MQGIQKHCQRLEVTLGDNLSIRIHGFDTLPSIGYIIMVPVQDQEKISHVY